MVNFGRLTGNLTMQNDVLSGNRAQRKQLHAERCRGHNEQPLRSPGRYGPGEEKVVDLGLATCRTIASARSSATACLRIGLTLERLAREYEMKSNIISSVFESGGWSKGGFSSSAFSTGSYSGILFFGWLDQAPPDVKIADNAITHKTTALVYTSLDYQNPKEGPISLPPGMVPGRIAVMPQEGGNCGWNTSVHMGRGQAEFEYRVPEKLSEMQIQSLRLSMWRDNTSPWNMPELSLYDWETETWTIIKEPIQGINVVQNAAPLRQWKWNDSREVGQRVRHVWLYLYGYGHRSRTGVRQGGG
jgi:hypothetical protein